jgi:hypothetical protein
MSGVFSPGLDNIEKNGVSMENNLVKLETAIKNINMAFDEFKVSFLEYVEKLTELESMVERLKRDHG